MHALPSASLTVRARSWPSSGPVPSPRRPRAGRRRSCGRVAAAPTRSPRRGAAADSRRSPRRAIWRSIAAASPRRTGPVSASGKPSVSTFSATRAEERSEHLRGVRARNAGHDEELGADRRERRGAVRDEPRGRVVADGVELRERARRHAEVLREDARALLGRRVALHVAVAARERREERARGERDHRVHLRDARARAAQRPRARSASSEPALWTTTALFFTTPETARSAAIGPELTLANREDDDVGVDPPRRDALARGRQA